MGDARADVGGSGGNMTAEKSVGNKTRNKTREINPRETKRPSQVEACWAALRLLTDL
jgi:hypothetical protein